MVDFKDYKRSLKKILFAISALMLLLAGVSCTKDPWGSKCPKGAVDLGIVMTRADGTTYKLYWAKSNLCESGLCANPEDYGDYYAWGETEPYYTKGHSQDSPCSSWRDGKTKGYVWESYKFRTSGDDNFDVQFSKYVTNSSYGPKDNIKELQRGEKSGETTDDVARAKLRRKWRMPTEAEWTALRDLKWDWTTINGINGCVVTGKNGNSIFLPAAGGRGVAKLINAGDVGYYWSSSLDTGSPYFAEYVRFISEGVFKGDESRFYGFSIRPVSE